jgi:hypothetical protein
MRGYASNFTPNVPNIIAKILNVVAIAPCLAANDSTFLNVAPKLSQTSP